MVRDHSAVAVSCAQDYTEAYTFVKSSTFMHRQKVLNVVPGDFTQDGKLDMLVMGQDHSQVSLQVYLGLPQGGFSEH